MTRELSFAHFHPYSFWSVEQRRDRSTFSNGDALYIIDSHTGDKYLNEDLDVIWFKCFLLSVGTPVIQTMVAIVRTVRNLLELISLYDFWKRMDDRNDDNLTQRSLDAGFRIFEIIFAPISVLLLEFAALYGMILPRDGRKLYASLETLTYGDYLLAPCFQPKPERHLLGGDLMQQNVF